MGFFDGLLSKAVNTAVSSITGDGLISGLVGIGSGLLSSKGASDANAANAEQADINRSFQERMRATQYQTAVGDLKAAGLNPMLAYTNGGAGNLSGATATMQDTLTPGVNSGMAARRNLAEVEQLRSLREKTDADAALSKTNAMVAAASVPMIQAQTAVANNSANQVLAQTNLTQNLANKALEDTKNVVSERARIEAVIKNVEAQTRNMPLTGAQILAATQLALAQVTNTKADTRLKGVQADRASTENTLGLLSIPRASNEANVQDSWWMENISPYLPDFLKSASSARALLK